MSNKITNTDAIDEALKIVFLNADTDSDNVIDTASQLKYIVEADYPSQMTEELSAKMIDRLYNKLAVDSLGILLTNALREKKLDTSKISEEVNLPVANGPTFSPFGETGQGWMITKYDALSRPISTGWFNGQPTTSSGRKNYQTIMNSGGWSEMRYAPLSIDNINVSYTDRVYPVYNEQPYKLLTISYYDDYNYHDIY